MSKYLFITGLFPPSYGGVQNLYYHIVNRFDPRETVVLTTKNNNCSNKDMFHNHSFTLLRKNFLSHNFKFKKSIRGMSTFVLLFIHTMKAVLKDDIKVILCGHFQLFVLTVCFITFKILKRPFVTFVHGEELPIKEKRNHPLYRIRLYLLNQSKAIIANSNYTRNKAICCGVDKCKIFVINPGLDYGKYQVDFNIDSLRRKYNVNNKIVLLTVGRMEERKGQDMVVRAIGELKHKYSNIHYIIVGSDWGLKNKIYRLIKKYGLENCVTCFDSVSEKELIECYNVSDMFVMPNKELAGGDAEGFGMVFLEASACGKPVIGGRNSGVVDAVENGYSGFLVDAEDLNDLTETVSELIVDFELRNRLGKQGRYRAKRYDWEQYVLKLKNVFLRQGIA